MFQKVCSATGWPYMWTKRRFSVPRVTIAHKSRANRTRSVFTPMFLIKIMVHTHAVSNFMSYNLKCIQCKNTYFHTLCFIKNCTPARPSRKSIVNFDFFKFCKNVFKSMWYIFLYIKIGEKYKWYSDWCLVLKVVRNGYVL